MKTHWAARLVSLIAILDLQISSVYPQSASTAKRPDVRLFSSTKVIKGDGLAGRIPKFIDTDVIADSVIIELSGSIGMARPPGLTRTVRQSLNNEWSKLIRKPIRF